jgi:hypothetical protein
MAQGGLREALRQGKGKGVPHDTTTQDWLFCDFKSPYTYIHTHTHARTHTHTHTHAQTQQDLASAEALAQNLGAHLQEEEIYRVDHYMGKTAVQAILPFRHANKHWLEGMWDGRHVEAIEVVMKETEDCEGRTAFYEVGHSGSSRHPPAAPLLGRGSLGPGYSEGDWRDW